MIEINRTGATITTAAESEVLGTKQNLAHDPAIDSMNHETGDVYVSEADSQMKAFHLKTTPDFHESSDGWKNYWKFGTAGENESTRYKTTSFVFRYGSESQKRNALYKLARIMWTSTDENTRYDAAGLVFEYGNTTQKNVAIDVFRNIMTSSKDAGGRVKAAGWILRNYRSKTMRDVLGSWIDIMHYDTDLRSELVVLEKKALNTLINAITTDENKESVRYDAAKLVFKYGDKCQKEIVTDALIKIIITSTNEAVRCDAAKLVFKYGDKYQKKNAVDALMVKIMESGTN